jgi:hypothetical protein
LLSKYEKEWQDREDQLFTHALELTGVIEKQKQQLEVKEQQLLKAKNEARDKGEVILELEKQMRELRSSVIKEEALTNHKINERQKKEFDEKMLVVEAQIDRHKVEADFYNKQLVD